MSINSLHDLTAQDIDILIEAVEAWENKDMAGDLMVGLFESAFADKSDPAVAAKMKADREERTRERDRSKRQRKEQSILLRAKLIHILDAARASTFTVDAFREAAMTAIAAPSVHKAWLSVRADVAHDALTDHINACNPCWSAIHMPGRRYLCPVGDDLTSAYTVAATADQDAEAVG